MSEPTEVFKPEESSTNRGFQLITWTDLYGKECQLQQSSLAIYTTPGTGAVWLGTPEARMHLNEEQVKGMIAYLNTWLETGEFHQNPVAANQIAGVTQ